MENIKQSTFRSTPYPSISLEEAIIELGKVKANLGKGSYGRESIAHALGYKGLNGAAIRKVAALVHFGLLERNGNTYKYSPLSERILFPINEDDKKLAIIEAAFTPKLYTSLRERYVGSAIPSMLENILIQQFKISDQVSKSAAADFIRTMEFAGLLINGVLSERLEDSTHENVDKNDIKDREGDLGNGEIPQKPKRQGYTELPPLPSGIIVLFPEDLAPYASLGKFSDGVNLLEDKAIEIREKLIEGVS